MSVSVARRAPTFETVAGLLNAAESRLGSDSPALDAQVLLAHALGRPRTWLLARPEAIPSPRDAQSFLGLLERAAAGEPIPYLIGAREFYGLDFIVTPAVLIPRPETELLVDKALGWLERQQTADRRPPPSAVRGPRSVADIGTGSGCIAVALARFASHARIVATDISAEALEVAQANARKHEVVNRIEFFQGDLLEPLAEPVNLICANLPYVPTPSLDSLQVARSEPRLALDGGPDGLDLIRRLLGQAPAKLASHGALLLEIEAGQGAEVLALAQAALPAAQVGLRPDLAGRDRLLEIQT